MIRVDKIVGDETCEIRTIPPQNSFTSVFESSVDSYNCNVINEGDRFEFDGNIHGVKIATTEVATVSWMTTINSNNVGMNVKITIMCVKARFCVITDMGDVFKFNKKFTADNSEIEMIGDFNPDDGTIIPSKLGIQFNDDQTHTIQIIFN